MVEWDHSGLLLFQCFSHSVRHCTVNESRWYLLMLNSQQMWIWCILLFLFCKCLYVYSKLTDLKQCSSHWWDISWKLVSSSNWVWVIGHIKTTAAADKLSILSKIIEQWICTKLSYVIPAGICEPMCWFVSSVCVNAAVLFCVYVACPLSRSPWWRGVGVTWCLGQQRKED